MNNENNLDNIKNISTNVFNVSTMNFKEKQELKDLKMLNKKTNRDDFYELPLFWKSEFSEKFKFLINIRRKFRRNINKKLSLEEKQLKELVENVISSAKTFYKELYKKSEEYCFNKIDEKGNLINLNENEKRTVDDLLIKLNEIKQLKENYLKTIRKFNKTVPSFWKSKFGKQFRPLENLQRRFDVKKNYKLMQEESNLKELAKKTIYSAKKFFNELCEKQGTINFTNINTEGDLINLNENEKKIKEELLKNLNKLKKHIRPIKKQNIFEKIPCFHMSQFGEHFKPLIKIQKRFQENKNKLNQEQIKVKELVKEALDSARIFYNGLCKNSIKNNFNKVNLRGKLINLSDGEEKTKNELLQKLNEIKEKYIKPVKRRKYMKNSPSFWKSGFGKCFKPLVNLKYGFEKKEKNKNLTTEQNELKKLIGEKIQQAKNFYDNLSEITEQNKCNKINLKGNLINLNEDEKKIKNELFNSLNEIKQKNIRPILKPARKRKHLKNYPSFWKTEFGLNIKPLVNLKYNVEKKSKKEKKPLTQEQNSLIELIEKKIGTAKNFYNTLCESRCEENSKTSNLNGSLINLDEDEQQNRITLKSGDLLNFVSEINQLKEKYIRPKKLSFEPVKKRKHFKDFPAFWNSNFGKNFKVLLNKKRKFNLGENLLATKEQNDLEKLMEKTINFAKSLYENLCEKTEEGINEKVNIVGDLINLDEDETKIKDEILKNLQEIKVKHIRPKKIF